MAGLWEVWYDAEDKPLRTCTIITTEPNVVLASVHDRMPVILSEESWDRWLAPEPLTNTEAATMLGPAQTDLLVLTKVSTLVNSASNDGPELVEPVRAD